MAPEEFGEWHELFKAQLLSQDSKWSKVLEVIDKIKREEGEFNEEKFTEAMGKGPVDRQSQERGKLILICSTSDQYEGRNQRDGEEKKQRRHLKATGIL